MVIQTGDLRISISQAAHTSRVDRQEAERSAHLSRLGGNGNALEIVIKLLNASVLGLAVAEDLGVTLTQLGDGLLKIQNGDALLTTILLESLLNVGNLLVLLLYSLSQRANLTLKIGNGGTLLVMGLGADRLAGEQGIVLVEGLHILLAPVFSFMVGGLGLRLGLWLGLGDEHLGAGHNLLESRNQFGNGLIEFGHINFLL
jgi:hypothetical protein